MARKKRHARRATTAPKRRRKRRAAAAAPKRRRKRRAAAAAPKRRRKRRAAAAAPKRRRKRRAAAAAPKRRRKRRAAAAPKRPRRAAAPKRRRRSSGELRYLSPKEREILSHHQRALTHFQMRSRERGDFKKRRQRGEVYGPVPNPRKSTQASLLRARRAIRNKYKTSLGRATQRRYRMRSNPSGMGDLMKLAGATTATLYVTRALANKVAPMIPGLNSLPAQFQAPAVAALTLGIAHFTTSKVAALKQFRTGIMLGAGINLIDAGFRAFAPTEIKAAFGLGGIYDTALSDYVTVNDYVEVNGAPPIDDDITLADYISVGDDLQEDLGVEEELGLSQELGIEQELGDSLSRSYLGGVSRSSMLAPVAQQKMLAAIPARSFTKEIGRAGPGYDKSSVLYNGIFAGSF